MFRIHSLRAIRPSRSQWGGLLLAIAALLAGVWSAVGDPDPPHLAVAPLAGPEGRAALPRAISGDGRIAGAVQTGERDAHGAAVDHAFYTVNAQVTELPTLAGDEAPANAAANGINSQGEVVGESETATGAVHAFLYRAGELTDLGALLGTDESRALAISDTGLVVGTMGRSAFYGNAFVWSATGGTIDLGPGVAYAVNSSDQVVGETVVQDGKTVPFVFRDANGNNALDPEERILLGTLGGDADNAALDINDRGVVVGRCSEASVAAATHAVRWDVVQPGASPTDLGTLGPGPSIALSVTEDGKVVGTSDFRAFLWENGVMSDLEAALAPSAELDAPSWIIQSIAGINTQGKIIGEGVEIDTRLRAGFVLVPPGAAGPALASLNVRPASARAGRRVTVSARLTTRTPARVRIPVEFRMDGASAPAFSAQVTIGARKQSDSARVTIPRAAEPGSYTARASYGGATGEAALTITRR